MSKFKPFSDDEIRRAKEWAKNLTDDQFIYYLDLEAQWRHAKKNIPEEELLKDFPSAKRMVEEKIDEWQERLQNAKKAIKEEVVKICAKYTSEWERWFWQKAISVQPIGQEAQVCLKNLKRLKYLKKSLRKTGVLTGKNTQDRVNFARNYPIELLVQDVINLCRVGRNMVGLCPFHNENTASFTVYLETNSVWCFGCQKGGDPIEFIRLKYGFTFSEAVNFLTEDYHD